MADPYISDLNDSTTVTLDRILEWEEVKVSRVPIQMPIATQPLVGDAVGYGDSFPLVFPFDFYGTAIPYFVNPRTINIQAKLNRTNKVTMQSLRDDFDWVKLYDYDGSLVDYMWMKEALFDWIGYDDYDRCWLANLTLICSQT